MSASAGQRTLFDVLLIEMLNMLESQEVAARLCCRDIACCGLPAGRTPVCVISTSTSSPAAVLLLRPLALPGRLEFTVLAMLPAVLLAACPHRAE